jgi:hypothetical protein
VRRAAPGPGPCACHRPQAAGEERAGICRKNQYKRPIKTMRTGHIDIMTKEVCYCNSLVVVERGGGGGLGVVGGI